MTKVTPSEMNCEPSTSTAPTKPGFFSSLSDKIIGYMVRKLDRRESTITDASVENAIGNGHSRHNSLGNLHLPVVPVYQQSSTRRLAFGEMSSIDETNKVINDFYNNSTLTNISKLFCALVLVIAFVLVMSRSFNYVDERRSNSTELLFF